jgi:P27 family predicted phage terminase small subunit
MEEWKRVAPELEVLGLLSEVDRNTLARYCQHYAYWHEAVTELQNKGLIMGTKNGNVVQSIYMGIANRASDIMTKLEAELGMTPSSRTRIGVGPKVGESKFDGLIGKNAR